MKIHFMKFAVWSQRFKKNSLLHENVPASQIWDTDLRKRVEKDFFFEFLVQNRKFIKWIFLLLINFQY
jgi:hypothetical protein